MIGFRFHVISIVAVFLALATGIALGAGPLQDPLTAGLVDQANQDRLDKEALRSELDTTREQLTFVENVVDGTSGVVQGSVLSGRTVSIVSLPGSDSGSVPALREQVVDAGGSVVSTVALTRDLLDPVNRQLAEGLAQRLLTGDRLAALDDATSYQLLGAAFARSFLTLSGGTTERDDDASSIQAALEEAGFLNVVGPVQRRAQLALIVAGDPDVDAPDGQAEVAAELASALDTGSVGAVVAGTPASAEDGVVAAVRDSDAADSVSSVDAVDLPAGRMVTVLALAEQAGGGVGQYGLQNAEDGAVPQPVPGAGSTSGR